MCNDCAKKGDSCSTNNVVSCTMFQSSKKAKGTGEIVCDAWSERGKKCPKHPRGHRYRGVNKCWGCPSAKWYSTGKPYGPVGQT